MPWAKMVTKLNPDNMHTRYIIHMVHVNRVYHILQQQGLTFSPNKCTESRNQLGAGVAQGWTHEDCESTAPLCTSTVRSTGKKAQVLRSWECVSACQASLAPEALHQSHPLACVQVEPRCWMSAYCFLKMVYCMSCCLCFRHESLATGCARPSFLGQPRVDSTVSIGACSLQLFS